MNCADDAEILGVHAPPYTGLISTIGVCLGLHEGFCGSKTEERTRENQSCFLEVVRIPEISGRNRCRDLGRLWSRYPTNQKACLENQVQDDLVPKKFTALL